MTIFTSTTGHAWSRDIMDGYMKRDEQNFVDTLAVVMKALYHRRAQQAVAGPAGFYWIALMSLSLPGLVRKCEGALGDYFRWLGAKVGENPMPSQSHPVNPDRVLAFLLERLGDIPKEQDIQSERASLTRGERTRLFFGENKNRWTSGAILRFLLLILFLTAFGLGCLLLYQGFEERQVRQDLQAQKLQEIDTARAEFRETILQKP